MEDYGEVELINTKFMEKKLLVCESAPQSGQYYLFRRKSSKRLSTGEISTYYICRFCESADGVDNDRCARVTERGGRIRTNPGVGHTENCISINRFELEAKKISDGARKKCRSEGKRPLQAYREAVNEVPRAFHDQETQEQVELALPPYKKIRAALYRHTNKRFIPIDDPMNLPVEYKLTLRGREDYERLNADDQQQDNHPDFERFLLHQEPGLLVFASDLDLQILSQSEYVVCDGTFKMAPHGFLQLYTFHGFCNGEGKPLCHALLSNKLRITYERLFTILRDNIHRVTNGRLIAHHVLMDFERAAHDAFLTVFHVQPSGCLFHLGQCLQRWTTQHGLKTFYEEQDSPLRRYCHLLKSLALLPPDLIVLVWNQWLRVPPHTDNPRQRRILQDFVRYFETNWIYGYFNHTVWNHYGNTWQIQNDRIGQPGPRTSNHAEGWHSKLSHDFGHPHPALNTFLDWLQQTHNVTQVRLRQLRNNGEPNQRDRRYIQVDDDIYFAKIDFMHHRAALNLADLNGHINLAQWYLNRVLNLLGE